MWYLKIPKYLEIKRASKLFMSWKEITKIIFKYFEVKENKNTIHENVWDAIKAVIKGRFVVLNAYVRKEERFKLVTKSSTLKKLWGKQQNKSKVSRQIKIIQIRTEIIIIF